MPTDYTADIENIKRELLEIEKQEEELKLLKAEKNGILKFLKSKNNAISKVKEFTPPLPTQESAEISANGVIDLSKFNVSNQYRKTLIDDVWAVVSKLGDQEFMVTSIEAVLNAQGVSIEGKAPRARIASTLTKLLAEGKITQSFKGGGNVPHKYQIAKKGKDVINAINDTLFS